MNCALYARVSTEKQADKDLSIPAQITAMREYAQRQGWNVTGEFIEPGASAKTADRPVLRRLLAEISGADSQLGVVLVHKIDRLARNVYDHATIRALLKKRGVRLASVVENVDETVSGELVENIMASIAQFYSANLGEEVKKGMRQKVLKGGWPHNVPLGYVSRKDANLVTVIEVDPESGPLIRVAFELYATGRWGVRALADHLRQQGLHTRRGGLLAQSYIRRLLVNPFYAGRVRWEGKEYPGAHPVLVPTTLFDQVQTVVRKRRSDPRRALSPTAFPLKAVAVCASCRGTMTAEMHGAWSYYRCCRRMENKDWCPARLCNAKKAHDGLSAICAQLRLSATLLASVEKAAAEIIRGRAAANAEERRTLQQRRAQLLAREATLTRSFVETKISPDSYQSLNEALRLERTAVEARLDEPANQSELQLAFVTETLKSASSVSHLFAIMAPARQAALLRLVFEVIVLGPSGVVGHVLREPFASIFEQEGGRREGTLISKRSRALAGKILENSPAEWTDAQPRA